MQIQLGSINQAESRCRLTSSRLPWCCSLLQDLDSPMDPAIELNPTPAQVASTQSEPKWMQAKVPFVIHIRHFELKLDFLNNQCDHINWCSSLRLWILSEYFWLNSAIVVMIPQLWLLFCLASFWACLFLLLINMQHKQSVSLLLWCGEKGIQ